jgi:FMN-dependent oxidoreductase (nitrilotriacetate monooxygenase family)
MSARQLHLSFINPHFVSSFTGGWRHPSSEPEKAISLASIIDVVQTAERACFDAVFLADSLVLPPNYARDPNYAYPFDPLMLLGVLAAHTTRIGLISTVSTTAQHPYDVARKFATLDWASDGRSGWNIVTSSNNAAARLFGEASLPDPATRYDQAIEYVELARKLWDTFDIDAMVFDKTTGVYADADKVHLVDHAGKYFNLQGGLNAPYIPQRYPVFVQAGQSEAGRDFAARYAEMVFTVKDDLQEAIDFAADIKARAKMYGRDPGSVKILPGLWALVCNTQTEAQQLWNELGALAAGSTPEEGLRMVALATGLDLTDFDLDATVPDPDSLPESAKGEANRGSSGLDFLHQALKNGWTIRQLITGIAMNSKNLSHAGTAEQVADLMQEWFEAGACDGFNFFPMLLHKFVDFTEGVLPILRDRGLFRTAYTGSTLRDHLGLAMPARPAIVAG